jgi:hypothetical protein
MLLLLLLLLVLVGGGGGAAAAAAAAVLQQHLALCRLACPGISALKVVSELSALGVFIAVTDAGTF